MQLRPAALARVLAHRDPGLRDAQRWYYRVGRRVWFREVGEFLTGAVRPARSGPTLEAFWGPPQAEEEQSMVVLRRRDRRASAA